MESDRSQRLELNESGFWEVKIIMRLLIYGAGVIGSLYAALFAQAGYNTSVYARGKRLEVLQTKGLLYREGKEVKKANISVLSKYLPG